MKARKRWRGEWRPGYEENGSPVCDVASFVDVIDDGLRLRKISRGKLIDIVAIVLSKIALRLHSFLIDGQLPTHCLLLRLHFAVDFLCQQALFSTAK